MHVKFSEKFQHEDKDYRELTVQLFNDFQGRKVVKVDAVHFYEFTEEGVKDECRNVQQFGMSVDEATALRDFLTWAIYLSDRLDRFGSGVS